MSLRNQLQTILKPETITTFLEYPITFTIMKYASGEETSTTITTPPLPSWFTLYELKLYVWELLQRNPLFAPPLMFLGIPFPDNKYQPLEILWSSLDNEVLQLEHPIKQMTDAVDERFVDSLGNEKVVLKTIRSRMTLNDVFQLDEKKDIPPIHIFIYSECVERIVAPKPLGDRDIYGRIVPYFPFLNVASLPTGVSPLPTMPVLLSQVDQVVATYKQISYLNTFLEGVIKHPTFFPIIEGIKLLRWVWDTKPESWESSALFFFATNVTVDRPYMRFFPGSGQPLVKVLVKEDSEEPIPNISEPRLFSLWNQEKIPANGKDTTYVKIKLNEPNNLYCTFRAFYEGTADLIIQPPKKKRSLDASSEIGDAPELLERVLLDTPFSRISPKLSQVSAVFKLHKKKSDYRISHRAFITRLKSISSLFQEIPPLPNEQPLIMLRYKGVSNFTNESRIFSYLTQNSEKDMLQGESTDDTLTQRVAEEFKITVEEARKQIAAWLTQKGELTLTVPDTKDFIAAHNSGIDIAVFEQHPVYTFHIYSDQNSKTYSIILHLLAILMNLPQETFTARETTALHTIITGGGTVKPPTPPESPKDDYGYTDYPDFLLGDQDPVQEEEKKEEIQEKQEQEEIKEQLFEKPSDVNSIKLTQYYIEKLALADPSIFNYEREQGQRGYVSHCAANDGRQPIVLDSYEFDEMMRTYTADIDPETGDMEILVYPDDIEKGEKQLKDFIQPNVQDDESGTIQGVPYPSRTKKEIVTVMKYGSKKGKLRYYLCPRLFCIRDRMLIRYKDFKGTVDKEGNQKPAYTCPLISSKGSPCRGTILTKEDMKRERREGNKTVLQRGKPDELKSIYIGILSKQKAPGNLYLPCCFEKQTRLTMFKKDDSELVRLGLLSPVQKPVAEAQPIADAIQAASQVHSVGHSPTIYEPNYYRVIHGVSVKSLVDANKVPLSIVVPRIDSKDEQKIDPKSGPQIGFLPEVLDEYFSQDSKSDSFAERDIVKKLTSSAQGFLRLAVDNSNPNQSILSALLPYFSQPSVEKLIDFLFEPIFDRIPPRKFIQINGGNLVHEFYRKYTFHAPTANSEESLEDLNYISMNDMRKWAFDNLGIKELTSSNIPAIERIMNSYRCFTTYIHKLKTDPSTRIEMRFLYDILSEPTIMNTRGTLFIILELTVEDIFIKQGDETKFKTDIKFDRVRCPSYPLNERQQQADVAFLIHYTRITKDRTKPSGKSYSHMGWEALFHVDGIHQLPNGRHKPSIFFQKSEDIKNAWPPIVRQRVNEFFEKCVSTRGPFTSMFTIDPNSLILPNDLMNAIPISPQGILRDSYNHLAGIIYKNPSGAGGGNISIPIADDGSRFYEGKIFLDWDDFKPAPVDRIINFFLSRVLHVFPQYKGYTPKSLAKSRITGKIEGLLLENNILIPATDPIDKDILKEYDIEDIDDTEWNINNTIAYDIELRTDAFKKAQNSLEEGVVIIDPKGKEYHKLDFNNSQNEVEDIYQHLRLTFSNWLATEGGRDIRPRLETILKSKHISLYDKRKQVDILLYSTVKTWLEPNEGDSATDYGFLRVDCRVQGNDTCSGRCKWVTEPEGASTCKIHLPRQTETVIDFSKMLYIRLVDELIRYASKRLELFEGDVSRISIKRDAQRKGDQYIIPMGTSAWKTWWEHLRNEWMESEKEEPQHFDEQYIPVPIDIDTQDTRTLPDTLKAIFGPNDPKTANFVWNPSSIQDRPFYFLGTVLRNDPLTRKPERELTLEEIKTISNNAKSNILYIKNDTSGFVGAMRSRLQGSTYGIIIVAVGGVPGWISLKRTYDVKIPSFALPDILQNKFKPAA